MLKKGRLIVAASETDADLLYASGFNAPDPFVWFESADHDRGIILNSLEYGRALSQSRKSVKVFNRDEFFSDDEDDKSMEKLLVALAGSLNVGEFEVPRDFPLFYADALREAGVKVSTGGAVFFPERQHKSAAEVEKITFGLRAAEDAERRVVEILRESTMQDDKTLCWQGEVLTSERLRYEIEIVLLRHGGVATSTIVACGRHSAEPHNPGAGPIFAGQPVVVDIFPRISATGYWGDITRTFVKGKAPKIVKKAYEAVKEARDGAKKMIKAGVKACDVHNYAAETMASYGFKNGRGDEGDYGFIHGLGHGVGLDIHEWPRVSKINDLPLAVGEVITVEPGLYYPEWGGIRLEDMVVVEEDGCRCLNEIDTFLEID